MPGWRVGRLTGAVADLHSRSVDFGRRSVTVCSAVDVAVVRGPDRPSGGGGVLVGPGDPLWVDVVVPRGDDLWDDDVGRAFWWLGAVWASVVGGRAVVHRGPMVRTRWSAEVCFAGLGPGEVTVGGRKVVGLAQRRVRDGALFQCAVHRTWDPRSLVSHLGLPAEAVDELADVVLPMGDRLEELERAFLDALP